MNYPVPTEIREIRGETSDRLKKKSQIDKHINLSKEGETHGLTAAVSAKAAKGLETKFVPLIDEGVMYDGGNAGSRIYIPKGELEIMLNKIPNDFVGIVNIGHEYFGSNPVMGHVGHYAKEDLKLEDMGNGRKRVMAKLHLKEEMNVVQDLKASSYDLALSVEMGYKIAGEVLTGEGDDAELVPLATDLSLSRIGIVGDGGNASSNETIKLNKGDFMANNQDNPIVDEPELETAADVVDETSKPEEAPAESSDNPKVEEEVATEVETPTEAPKEEAPAPEAEAETEEAPTADEVVAAAKKEVAASRVNTLATVIEGNPVAEAEHGRLVAERDHFKAEFAKLSTHYVELAKAGEIAPKSKTTVASKETDANSKSIYEQEIHSALGEE